MVTPILSQRILKLVNISANTVLSRKLFDINAVTSVKEFFRKSHLQPLNIMVMMIMLTIL